MRISTRVIPAYEVPRTTPPTAEDAALNPAFGKLAGLVLDMKELAETQPTELRAKLEPLVDGLPGLDRQPGEAGSATPATGLAEHQAAAEAALKKCRHDLARIEAGLKLLEEDAQAAEAFRFMNRAMWLQRTHSHLFRAGAPGRTAGFDKDIDVPGNRTWYPFQIAFILLNLPGVTKLDHPDRSEKHDGPGRPALLPHGRRQDGSLPGPVGLHDGPAAAARHRGRAGRARTAWPC